jgi:hypothetical protein
MSLLDRAHPSVTQHSDEYEVINPFLSWCPSSYEFEVITDVGVSSNRVHATCPIIATIL